jgi:uncharacterized damage-inducible protein DinB
MIHTIDEFLTEWAQESQSTLRVLNSLTDESLSVKASPNSRSLGFLAWHITNTIGEMMSKVGLDIQPVDDQENEPSSAQVIVAEYERLSAQMVKSLNDKWTNETLNQDFEMYGDVWKGSMVLDSLIKHEIHHRAQMTIIMRVANLKVPGLYGPSQEDWAVYGMPAHK